MKKLLIYSLLITMAVFYFGCKPNNEPKPEVSAIKIEIAEDKKTMTITYNSGKVQIFCQKSEGSSTYIACPVALLHPQ